MESHLPKWWGLHRGISKLRYNHQGRKMSKTPTFRCVWTVWYISHVLFLGLDPWIFLQFSKMEVWRQATSWHIGGHTKCDRAEIVRSQLWVAGNPWIFWACARNVMVLWCFILVHFPIQPIIAYTHIDHIDDTGFFFTDLWLAVVSVFSARHFITSCHWTSGRSQVAEPQPVFHGNQHLWSIWKWDMPPKRQWNKSSEKDDTST